jgi:hypothetical protein
MRLQLVLTILKAVPRQRGPAATAHAGLLVATLLRCPKLPEVMANSSLTSLRL